MRTDSDTPSRGRPRDSEITAAILATTLDHLAHVGYSAMSLAQIARDAGVTKPTIYRRWACKADLATAALMTIQAAEAPASTGTLRSDLVVLVQNFQESLLRPQGMAMIGMLLSEEARMPDLIRHFRERITTNRRRMFREAFQRAREDELPPYLDVEVAINMIIGSLYAKYIADGAVPESWAEQVVAAVLGPPSERGRAP